MSKTAIFILLLIIIGSTYFRDSFEWVWLVLGLGVFAFLIWFHWSEKHNDKKHKEG